MLNNKIFKNIYMRSKHKDNRLMQQLRILSNQKCITENIDYIIKTAFSSELGEESLGAFSLLLLSNGRLAEKLSKSDFFIDFFENKLENASNCFLSRFTNLMEKIIIEYPENSVLSLPFIYNLIIYTGKYPILYFIRNLLKEDKKLYPYQKWLIENDFINNIINKLLNIDFPSKREDIEMKNDLYGLLALAVQNDNIKNLIDSDCLFELMQAMTIDSTEQWNFVSNFVNKGNSEKFLILFNNAIDTITTRNSKVKPMFEQNQVYALNFMSKMIDYQGNKIFKQVSDITLPKYAVQIFKDFPNHTIALQAAESFSFMLFKDPKFRPFFIETFLPFGDEVLRDTELERYTITQRSFIRHLYCIMNEMIDKHEQKEELLLNIGFEDPMVEIEI